MTYDKTAFSELECFGRAGAVREGNERVLGSLIQSLVERVSSVMDGFDISSNVYESTLTSIDLKFSNNSSNNRASLNDQFSKFTVN